MGSAPTTTRSKSRGISTAGPSSSRRDARIRTRRAIETPAARRAHEVLVAGRILVVLRGEGHEPSWARRPSSLSRPSTAGASSSPSSVRGSSPDDRAIERPHDASALGVVLGGQREARPAARLLEAPNQVVDAEALADHDDRPVAIEPRRERGREPRVRRVAHGLADGVDGVEPVVDNQLASTTAGQGPPTPETVTRPLASVAQLELVFSSSRNRTPNMVR